MDSVEKVVYINLEHRVDRKEHIEAELLKVFPSDKIVRFNAIKHEKGGIGCSMSHIGALEMAISNNWKNVLVVEDDMKWNDMKSMSIVDKLLNNPYNVVILGGTMVSYDVRTYKLKSCQSRTAYIVHNSYYQTLLDNYKTGLQKLLKEYRSEYRGDQYWKRLQHNGWFVVSPALCIQKPDYSDIEKKNVNYVSMFTPTKKRILDRILKRSY